MIDARRECYDEVRRIVADACTAHYLRYPHWLGDERSQEGLRMVILPIVANVLALLDQYELAKKK